MANNGPNNESNNAGFNIQYKTTTKPNLSSKDGERVVEVKAVTAPQISFLMDAKEFEEVSEQELEQYIVNTFKDHFLKGFADRLAVSPLMMSEATMYRTLKELKDMFEDEFFTIAKAPTVN